MKLICTFVFSYAECWFSYDTAQIFIVSSLFIHFHYFERKISLFGFPDVSNVWLYNCPMFVCPGWTGGYKTVFMLNSSEHKI